MNKWEYRSLSDYVATLAKEGLVSKVIKIAFHIAIDGSVTDGPWRIQLHYFHDDTFLTENLCFSLVSVQ